MPSQASEGPDNYVVLLRSLQERIRNAQVSAALAVNRKLVLLYWQIGRDILRQQGVYSWGAKVIDRLAQDLRRAFPEMRGFSPRNLKYMRVCRDVAGRAICAQQFSICPPAPMNEFIG